MTPSPGSSLPAIAVAALTGNVAVQLLPALPSAAWIGLVGATAVAMLLVRRCRWVGWLGVSACLTLGVARAALDDRWPPPGEPADVAIEGYIDGFPTLEAHRAALTLRVTAAGDPRVPARVRLSWYDPPSGLAPGSTIAVSARLRAPRGLVNPGGFDYERWLLVEGIGATGYVRSGRVVEDGRSGPGWLGLRSRLAARLDAALDDRSAAALIAALTLGERGGFEDRHWDWLRRTGTSHLVAISGMHVGLIAALSFWLALRLALCLPGPIARHAIGAAAILAIGPAALYAALAGFALPTQRALAMLLVAQVVILTRRRAALASNLAIALLVVLALDPLATLQASFWLSFGAVAFILAVASDARARVADGKPLRRVALAACDVQWRLTLGLAPLIAISFGAVSLVSFPVNLVAIPFFSFVMVPTSLAAAFCVMVGWSGSPLVALAERLAAGAWVALETVAGWPGAAVTVPEPSWASMLAAAAAVVLAVSRHPLPGRRLAWIGLLPLFVAAPERLPTGAAQVTVFDVGHGLAVLVETRRHRLLYDAGPVYRSGFDVGGEIVVPALERAGVGALDALVLSHADSDHAGGAGAVERAVRVARRITGPDFEDAGERCVAGAGWTWDRVRFTFLHPPPQFAPIGNESSCVLEVATLHGSILLTGDIETRAERLLVDDPAVAADAIVVPHHGSATSSSPAFVAAVGPRYAIVSAGFDNRWGFPKEDVRRRWEDAGARVIVTGDEGAIRLTLTADDRELRLERTSTRRYWRSETPASSGVGPGSAL